MFDDGDFVFVCDCLMDVEFRFFVVFVEVVD